MSEALLGDIICESNSHHCIWNLQVYHYINIYYACGEAKTLGSVCNYQIKIQLTSQREHKVIPLTDFKEQELRFSIGFPGLRCFYLWMFPMKYICERGIFLKKMPKTTYLK